METGTILRCSRGIYRIGRLEIIYTIGVQKHNGSYIVVGPGSTSRVLTTARDLELWVRCNFGVSPDEFKAINASLEETGKASIPLSAGKLVMARRAA